jgi:hypothetical protein
MISGHVLGTPTALKRKSLYTTFRSKQFSLCGDWSSEI